MYVKAFFFDHLCLNQKKDVATLLVTFFTASSEKSWRMTLNVRSSRNFILPLVLISPNGHTYYVIHFLLQAEF